MKILAALCLLLAAATPLAAQQTTPPAFPLEKGDRVRIVTTASPEAIRGTVDEVGPGRLVLVRESDYRRAEIATGDVLDVSVYRGRNHLTGALLGVAAGGAAGFVVTKTTLDAQYSNDEWNGVYALVVGAPVGALTFGLIGGVVGLPRWEAVYPVTSLSIAPVPGGGMAVSGSFRVR